MTDPPATTRSLHVSCCVAGGGPAGMMAGFLLARAGVEVAVLEKHADFFRDFRGDTIHPSTLELMHELGLLEEFLKRPHQQARELQGWIGDERLTVADFSHLPTRCKFIAFMPQWDFLDFLAVHAQRCPTFRLLMQTEAVELIEDGVRVAGVRARGPDGALEIRADLVLGCDGRHSTVRDKARLEVMEFGAPMDVLWLKLSQRPDDPKTSLGRFDAGRIMVLIDRGDYWQVAFVIPKGTFEEIRRRGLPAFQADIVRLAPFLTDRVGEISDWNDVKLLTVAVDRLRRWYRPGLLCIGDAAHAMSPIGGVGINLAVQDAVAAANILSAPLRAGSVTEDHLRAVQRRRELPTRLTQRVQVLIQKRIIGRVLARAEKISLPLPLRLLQRCPFLRRIPARLIGLGFRPEHVRVRELARS
jgi:2-polyprenyl-6-methoxyphenol hydroxylase-like FAD-dependent oxidoreductase